MINWINFNKDLNNSNEAVIEYLDVEEENNCMIAIVGDKLKNLDNQIYSLFYHMVCLQALVIYS